MSHSTASDVRRTVIWHQSVKLPSQLRQLTRNTRSLFFTNRITLTKDALIPPAILRHRAKDQGCEDCISVGNVDADLNFVNYLQILYGYCNSSSNTLIMAIFVFLVENNEGDPIAGPIGISKSPALLSAFPPSKVHSILLGYSIPVNIVVRYVVQMNNWDTHSCYITDTLLLLILYCCV